MAPQELLNDLTGMVSLPEVCFRINQMVEDEHSSANDLATLIRQDVDLSARLLRIVNSAFYRRGAEVETISRAVTLVGTRELRDLAIMSAACTLFPGIPPDLLSMDDFWHQSVSCGVMAQRLARACNVLHPERLFVMGVLHDIGRLAMLTRIPAEYRDILLISQGRDELLCTAEKEVLGFTHCDVGYALARNWGLPDTLCEVIRHHHEPQDCTEYPLEASIVHLANVIADGLLWDEALEQSLSQVNSRIFVRLGQGREQCLELAEGLGAEVAEMYRAMIGRPGGGRTQAE